MHDDFSTAIYQIGSRESLKAMTREYRKDVL